MCPIYDEIDSKIRLAKNCLPDKAFKSYEQYLIKLKEDLEVWGRELIVLGYNSGSYDLNLNLSKLVRT